MILDVPTSLCHSGIRVFLQLSDTDAVLPRKVLGMGEVRFREVQKTSGVSSRLGL